MFWLCHLLSVRNLSLFLGGPRARCSSCQKSNFLPVQNFARKNSHYAYTPRPQTLYIWKGLGSRLTPMPSICRGSLSGSLAGNWIKSVNDSSLAVTRLASGAGPVAQWRASSDQSSRIDFKLSWAETVGESGANPVLLKATYIPDKTSLKLFP